MSGLRLPAFGKRLLELRGKGQAPDLAVLVQDGWDPLTTRADHDPWTLVVPDGEPAAAFDFRPVAGLVVYVVGQTIERVDELAIQILKFFPKLVLGTPLEGGGLAIYRKGAA